MGTVRSGTDFASRETSTSDSDFKLFGSATTQAAPGIASPTRRTALARRESNQKAVEGAVYGQIRALRALGVTKITTDQIARSLSIPRSTVDAAVKGMQGRGVKVTK